MEDDLKGLGIGSQDDEIGKASVESLGGLVCALLQFFLVGSLVKELHDFLGEFVVEALFISQLRIERKHILRGFYCNRGVTCASQSLTYNMF